MFGSIENYYALHEFPSPISDDGRIVSGKDASLGQFPYQLTLARKSGSLVCGASLITPILVISAAHCFFKKTAADVVIISGNHMLDTDDGHEQVVNVSRIILHEDYRRQDYRNDIAILFLSKEIILNTYTSTILLPTEDTKFEHSAIVSGWGYQHHGGSNTNTLQWTTVEMIPKQECRQMYIPKRKVIAGEVICALGKQGEDACRGDSGGPLACKGLDGKTYLCGIVSWGSGCGTFPGVYTNVAKFTDWIKSKIGSHATNDIYGGTPNNSTGTHHSIGKPNPLESLPFRCRSVGTFQCAVSKKCFPNEYKCNGKFDCGPDDHTDETGCPPRSSDGRIDEETMSEEHLCDDEEFYCSSSDQCIHKTYLCDGTVDCPDISLDEVGCDHDGRMEISQEHPCDQNHFYCASSNFCFPIDQYSYDEACPDNVDDGRMDPDDNLNTADALGTCNFGDFHCEQSNLCIPSPLRCNGNMDCDLGEDEDGCDTTDYQDQRSVNIVGGNYGPLPCDWNDGECTFSELSVPDTDGRMEESPCDENYFFHCASSNLCIPIVNRCNGQYDCGEGDYSDEEDCPEYLNPDSDENIQASFMHDDVDNTFGRNVEHDYFDSQQSTFQQVCSEDQFKCQNNQCIHASHECDHENDCQDGSDEHESCSYFSFRW